MLSSKALAAPCAMSVPVIAYRLLCQYRTSRIGGYISAAHRVPAGLSVPDTLYRLHRTMWHVNTKHYTAHA
eukprot:3894552-Rhodomonas_salina.1